MLLAETFLDPCDRNSRVLGLLDAMLHSPLGSFRVVELVGRGIAAEARCTQAVLEDKLTLSTGPVAVLLQRGVDHLGISVQIGEETSARITAVHDWRVANNDG